MKESLKRLGLTSYEAQAYLTLTTTGPLDASKLAKNSKIPTGRIYSILTSLEERGLVRRQDTRPKKYMAVQPQIAVKKLAETKKAELDEKKQEIDETAQKLHIELLGIARKKPQAQFWTVAVGEKEAWELSRELINQAEKEILFFLTSKEMTKKEPHPNHQETLNSLLKALEKGVKIRILLNPLSNLEEYTKNPTVKRLLGHLGKQLQCRTAENPTTPFDIIDSETVLLRINNPAKPEELLATVHLQNNQLAKELRKRFQEIWQEALEYDIKSC